MRNSKIKYIYIYIYIYIIKQNIKLKIKIKKSNLIFFLKKIFLKLNLLYMNLIFNFFHGFYHFIVFTFRINIHSRIITNEITSTTIILG